MGRRRLHTARDGADWSVGLARRQLGRQATAEYECRATGYPRRRIAGQLRHGLVEQRWPALREVAEGCRLGRRRRRSTAACRAELESNHGAQRRDAHARPR